MSSEEFQLRKDIVSIIDDVWEKLASAREIALADTASKPLTRDELVTLKQLLLNGYSTSATTMGVVKRLNAASNAHNSSLKAVA